MHKYEKLEKIYYRKKFLKFLIVFIISVIFILVGSKIFMLYNYQQSNSYKKNNDNNSSKKKEKNIPTVTVKTAKVTKISKNNNFKKEKNMTKNDNNITNKIPMISFVFPKIDINNTKEINNEINKEVKKYIKKKINNQKKMLPKIKEKNKQKPLIIEENVKIDDLINTYNQKPSFDLAIQISQYYLNKNKLDLAKLWALKANSINPSRYESWKIFAIILLRKNKKEKAKEVLQTYLNDYGQNDDIQKLLRSINE
ncbi:conserved hypothetical protein [Lebetimonas natsushimae]|uniref:Transformation system protein n=1 Tax=Lebetimonas natsushimae TaxID=1936991 RepID=A0A292YDL0_9BACT|nr:tetratricopeptide repeat protein [Lebetimonas natsushimae]GAX87294.1 conserved hypothetical protein [Lebetimonas natsushimae]